jgi:hypothetical protein
MRPFLSPRPNATTVLKSSQMAFETWADRKVRPLCIALAASTDAQVGEEQRPSTLMGLQGPARKRFDTAAGKTSVPRHLADN